MNLILLFIPAMLNFQFSYPENYFTEEKHGRHVHLCGT